MIGVGYGRWTRVIPGPQSHLRRSSARERRGRWLGVLLALATTGVQFAVPLLDSGARPDGSVVESEHDPAECQTLHDHDACLRLGANAWFLGPVPSLDAGRILAGDPAPRPAFVPHPTSRTRLPEARAPPTPLA